MCCVQSQRIGDFDRDRIDRSSHLYGSQFTEVIGKMWEHPDLLDTHKQSTSTAERVNHRQGAPPTTLLIKLLRRLFICLEPNRNSELLKTALTNSISHGPDCDTQKRYGSQTYQYGFHKQPPAQPPDKLNLTFAIDSGKCRYQVLSLRQTKSPLRLRTSSPRFHKRLFEKLCKNLNGYLRGRINFNFQ